METMPFKITNMKVRGKIKKIDIKKRQIVVVAQNDISKQKFDATINISDKTTFFDLASSKEFDAKKMKKGEYITAWGSVFDNADDKNITTEGLSVFKNVKGNEKPDKMPELIQIKNITQDGYTVKIKENSEFTWFVNKNTQITSLDGKTLKASDLKEGQKCFGYIDVNASSKTKETEVVSSKIITLK